ncbi:protein phosphatase [Monoraphidium neglectum]|uniref:protein-tyrosine-phosphatase n=1 Tax=Monoraphidium neglectum TaxID=145388 RepID=A0A0D2NBJ5_9CHLO|nr:protein phosphatase [Monoraphidium neglectum]KIZ02856.1 protein phosphatase [Monoraphidium neglectum]|eukprot:XP_013901875.1 protein phosphatase [Monoraphidium neglectum]
MMDEFAELYEPFYADFGPLNLGRTYRFCEITSRLLQDAEQRGKQLYLYCSAQTQQRANAAVLVGAFQVLLLGRSAEAAFTPLAALKPFAPFRDASCGAPCFNLQVEHCLRGLAKAAAAGFLDARGGAWRFDIEEYEHYEQVENGDLNWIVPGKLAAFSGPAASPNAYVGFRAMVPEDYWDYYRRRRVTAVVRLNKKVYDRRRFTDGGLRHHELYFPDGSCPPTELLLRFLDLAEQEPGALAIHCKAGLGRTGVLICSYIMKHYGVRATLSHLESLSFTAEEVIGYIRICRPGSVIGPQQNYLQQMQAIMWREGDAWRATHGPAPPPLAWGPAAPSRAGSMRTLAAGPTAGGPAEKPQQAAQQAARPFSLAVDATGDAFLSRQTSSGGGAARGANGGSSGGGGGTAARAPSASASIIAGTGGSRAGLGRAPSDLSLMQYAQEHTLQQAQQPAAAATLYGGVAGNRSSGGAARCSSSSNIAAVAAAYLGPGSSHGPSSAAARPSASQSRGRASTPQCASLPSGGGASGGGGNPFTSLFSVLGASAHGQLASALSFGRPATQAAAAARAAVPGAASLAAPSSRGRAPSAPRERTAGGPRAQGQAETAAAGARAKGGLPDGHLGQSADMFSSAWRTSISSGAASQAAAGALYGSRPQSNIVRVLAPNGQPRKVPAAMLQQGVAGGSGGSGSATGAPSRGPGSLMSSSLNGRNGSYY